MVCELKHRDQVQQIAILRFFQPESHVRNADVDFELGYAGILQVAIDDYACTGINRFEQKVMLLVRGVQLRMLILVRPIVKALGDRVVEGARKLFDRARLAIDSLCAQHVVIWVQVHAQVVQLDDLVDPRLVSLGRIDVRRLPT